MTPSAPPRATTDLSSGDVGAARPAASISGPVTGQRLRPFALPTPSGQIVQLQSYRQRRNLVLFFHHGPACAACSAVIAYLDGVAADYDTHDTTILAIGPAEPAAQGRPWAPAGLRLLIDTTASAAASQGFAPPALAIADRFGTLWAAWEGGPQHRLPGPAAIAEWLSFIEIQCPECTMIAWED